MENLSLAKTLGVECVILSVFGIALLVSYLILKRIRKKLAPSYYKESYDTTYLRFPDQPKDIARSDVKYYANTVEQKRIVDEFFFARKTTTTRCKPKLKTLSDRFFYVGNVFCCAWCVNIIVLAISVFTDMFLNILNKSLYIITILAILGIAFCVLSIIFATKFKKSITITTSVDKTMSISEYNQLLANKIESLDVQNRAIQVLGLDITQIQEIPPVVLTERKTSFEDYGKYSAHKALRITIKDSSGWNVAFSCYCISCWFFTDTQALFYKITFDMCHNDIIEKTEEIFYTDICNIHVDIQASRIALTTNDAVFYIHVKDEKQLLSISQGLKHKIRENKQPSTN